MKTYDLCRGFVILILSWSLMEIKALEPEGTTGKVLTADFAAPLGDFTHAPGRALSTTPGRSAMNAEVWRKLRELHLEHVRIWLRFPGLFDEETLFLSGANRHDPLSMDI